ncbi:magnesium-translocating P-type ATPase [Pseudonocardia acaciae]|uniref:magnesium-translocating P-type ATPase n=1 Tax=Pseudonocardia acaciae TaxID=551276 RepID=UPI00068645E2|nr:magnesium-translocating P-type ATPase [Pseudonocardia acaciae]
MADGRIGAGHEVALRGLAAAPPLTLCQRLGTSPRGLTEAEAEQRWDPGHPDPAEPTALGRLRAAFLSPFVLLLVGLAAVFAALGDARGWVTIAVMVAISVGLRWWLRTRSDRAVRRLRSRVTRTATVRRRCAVGQPGVWREVPVEDLVPGDVVSLAAGDVVPADLRLLHANGLRVDQSVLSGEATPVRKRAPSGQEPPEPPEPRPARTFWPWRRKTDTDVVDLPSVCFAGTSVVSGTATAVVMTTGPGTYFGALARDASGARPESSVDHGVRAVGRTLIRFMLVLVPIVLVVNGSVTGDWAQAGLFAVAVAVGLTPEMLPAIVTATLARGAVALSRRDVIVKRLDSIQDLGGMDVLCLDKTGTLTEDRVAFAHSVDLDGQLDDSAVEYAYLIGRSLSGPPDRFDRAIQDYVTEDEALLARAMYTKVDELGFDHDRRRASVVVRDPAGEHLLITSGDPDEILARCTSYQAGAQGAQLDAARRREAADLVAAHEAHGMRVLAVASRLAELADPGGLGGPAEPDDLERDLTLIGFVAFVDPVKATMPDAVERLAEHGVAVKMLTGDSALVAEQVCKRAGIPVGRIVLGHDVERASDSALAELVERTTVFAKVNPQHKARIIAALRRRGHCVGFLGDGANDTTALRTADVGICVHNATPAARDAADLVLLDTDPTVLVNGVVAGRRTLGNTMKYVKITAASNLGNVFSVLAASLFLPFLPMLPVQLLAQNLIYDAAQLALPFDRVEPGYLRRPRRWDARRLVRFMLVFGPLSSLFDLATFGVLWWLVGANTPAEQSVFQAGWFTVGLLSQVLVVLVLRGRGLTRPAYAVLAAATAAVLVGLALPRSPWASALQMTAPPPAALPWLLAIVAAYLLAAILVKKKTREWLALS